MGIIEKIILIIASLLLVMVMGKLVAAVFARCIKARLDYLNDITENIESSESRLEALEKNTKSKQEELEKAEAKLESVYGEIEDLIEKHNGQSSRLTELKNLLDETSSLISDYKQKADKLGIYVAAAEALAEDRAFDFELCNIHEVPFLDKRIANVPLRNSIKEALKIDGIDKVWELVNASEDDLLALPGVGPVAVNDINRILNANDCYLGMPFINVDGRYYTNKA